MCTVEVFSLLLTFTPRYRERLCRYDKTRPSPVAIGERRKPAPGGRPGFLRIDTVHQDLGHGQAGKQRLFGQLERTA